MKIKIQKQTTVTEEIEVEFPVFLKYGDSFIKVLSEDSAITTSSFISGNMKHFDVKTYAEYKGNISLFFKEGKPSTEEEFNAAYQQNMDGILNFQFAEMRDATEAEKREAAEDEGRELDEQDRKDYAAEVREDYPLMEIKAIGVSESKINY